MSEPASRTNPIVTVVGALGLLITFFVLACGESGREVTKAEFGKAWPFSVSSGRVDCVKGLAYIFKANGKTYGLNGHADAWGIADADLKDIWLKDPEYPELDLRIGIGAIQDAASEQC